MKNIRLILVMLFIFSVAACSSDKFATTEHVQGQSAEQLFNTGERMMASGDYDTAVKYFESLDSQYPFSKHSRQMLLDLVYSYYRAGDHASAAATAQRYIHLYPRGKDIDYAYYMRGVANFEQEHGTFTRFLPVDAALRDPGDSIQAYDDFSEFIRRFPRSKYVPDARQRMIFLRNIFAQKDIYAARFYMDKHAYVAAANRASNIVRLFGQAPQVEEALAIMVKANRQLKLQKQADDALATLKLNYPNSKYLRGLS